MSNEEIMKKLENLLEEAEEVARKMGEVIGRVSRGSIISTTEEGLRIDIPFESYVKSQPRHGSLVAIAVPTTRRIILARIKNIERLDMMAMAKVPVMHVERDPRTLLTPTRLVAEPLCERSFEGAEVMPPTSPIDPQSPVFIPSDALVEEMLGISGEGIDVGFLFEANKERRGVRVRLNNEILKHHILVVGTTGSGKTTLLRRIFLQSSKALALDIQGDYLKTLVKAKAADATFIVPITQRLIEEVCRFEECKSYLSLFQRILRLRRGFQYVSFKEAVTGGVKMNVDGAEILVVPMALERNKILEIIEAIPILSQQASIFAPNIIMKCQMQMQDLGELVECIYEQGKEMRLHTGTIDNLIRAVRIIYESGLLDVQIPNRRSPIREPNYAMLLNSSSKIVVDLGIVGDTSTRLGPIIVAYRILSKVFEYFDNLYKSGSVSQKGPEPFLLILDEAHSFFPQGSREGFERESVEELLNKIMRLGRMRGLSCVMATHTPQDLNDLVISLANTKIALRSDRDILRRIGMESHSKLLETAPPGLGVIRTFAHRVTDLYFRVEPP